MIVGIARDVFVCSQLFPREQKNLMCGDINIYLWLALKRKRKNFHVRYKEFFMLSEGFLIWWMLEEE